MVEKRGEEWAAVEDGNSVLTADTQDEAAQRAHSYAGEHASGSQPISVRVLDEDGTVGDERTFPRWADPSRRPG